MAEYRKRDIMAMRRHYEKHFQAMTAEGLHEKSDIAAELAWRDYRIERLESALLAAYNHPLPGGGFAPWMEQAENVLFGGENGRS